MAYLSDTNSAMTLCIRAKIMALKLAVDAAPVAHLTAYSRLSHYESTKWRADAHVDQHRAPSAWALQAECRRNISVDCPQQRPIRQFLQQHVHGCAIRGRVRRSAQPRTCMQPQHLCHHKQVNTFQQRLTPPISISTAGLPAKRRPNRFQSRCRLQISVHRRQHALQSLPPLQHIRRHAGNETRRSITSS